jgi:hypothetical protein
MRLIFTFLLVFAGFTLHAASFKANVPYHIISDVKTNDLLSGQVRVVGTIFSSVDRAKINRALVATMDNRVKTLSDSIGHYELIIHESDTSIFVYSDNYAEVALPSYDFKAGHTVTINFTLSPAKTLMEAAFKPVIYLYSNQPQTATIKLNVHGDLTFSYPNYDKGWEVRVDQMGALEASNGRQYPYLFWEGNLSNLRASQSVEKKEGWVIQTDSIVSFLENQLAAIGLNSTEKTDLITFWAPRILSYKFAHIQFLLSDAYKQYIAEIEINPQPTALLRIFLLFKGYDEHPTFEVIPQSFSKFERYDFTVVEWGGSELK